MIHQKSKNLWLIDLDQKRGGFKQFIASWLLRKKKRNILIDPGPASTIPVLIDALDALGINKPDSILLTHIHIDHAGGVGNLLKRYPDTPVFCHPRAIPHLADPTRLWQGTKKVLGDLADLYGPILPVPGKNLFDSTEIDKMDPSVSVIETPGHAAHHISFHVQDVLFAGEAYGVTIQGTDSLYLRPATPPVFIYEVYKDSLIKLRDLNSRKICFGHYGMIENPDEIQQAALSQLELWMETIQDNMINGRTENLNEVFTRLQHKDPALQSYLTLPADIQNREWYFIENSIKGMTGYLIKNGVSRPETVL